MIFSRLLGRRYRQPEPVSTFELPHPESRGSSKPAHYLCVATMIRNEACYAAEWVAFHRAVGVEHVVIYDNDSSDDLAGALAPEIASGCVEIIPWPQFATGMTVQRAAFAHAIRYLSGRTQWLAIIDVDEFLFSTQHIDLKEHLRTQEPHAALAAYWVNYGTSGHATRPTGRVIENYLERARDNSRPGLVNYKSIVQPHRITAVGGAHRFKSDMHPIVAVDEDGRGLTKVDRRHVAGLLRINHYYSRSAQEFEERLVNGWARLKPGNATKRRATLAAIEADTVIDTAILKIVPYMKPERSQAPDELYARVRVPLSRDRR